MKHDQWSCDVCKGPVAFEKEKKGLTNQEITVVFRTEQDEGRSCAPYIQTVKLDICHDCLETMYCGHILFAEGAMGFNKYYFPNKP